MNVFFFLGSFNLNTHTPGPQSPSRTGFSKKSPFACRTCSINICTSFLFINICIFFHTEAAFFLENDKLLFSTRNKISTFQTSQGVLQASCNFANLKQDVVEYTNIIANSVSTCIENNNRNSKNHIGNNLEMSDGPGLQPLMRLMSQSSIKVSEKVTGHYSGLSILGGVPNTNGIFFCFFFGLHPHSSRAIKESQECK